MYNLYPKTIWKEITKSILGTAPHDSIAVHISLPPYYLLKLPGIKKWLQNNFPKITHIFWSFNRKKLGESKGFDVFRKRIDFTDVGIVTYAHSKGSSSKRKNTPQIRDWTEMIRYFVVERLDLARKAFSEGYHFAGVNLNSRFHVPVGEEKLYRTCRFIYEGNFISINLDKVRGRFLSTPCPRRYYGLERFWGMLGNIEDAKMLYNSNPFDHYKDFYPPERYRE